MASPGWYLTLAEVLLLMLLGFCFEAHSVWNWAWEPDTGCEHPALPGNRSGVQVLVYGPAKSGTKSMAKALHRLGFAHTYHAEDFLNSVWAPLADRFWRQPESGAPWRLASIGPPASKGHPAVPSDSDLRVLRGLAPGDLAAAVSRCRIDAVTFDAIDTLFWPIFEVSPGAKVVALSWRTYSELLRSQKGFYAPLGLLLVLVGLLCSSAHVLPWPVVLVPLLDYLSGRSIHTWLTTGGPPATLADEGPARKFLRQSMASRRWLQHCYGGLEVPLRSEAEYAAYWQEVRKRVPAGDLLEWDMRRDGMKDLCAFLSLDGPVCAEGGPLPKVPDLLYMERQWPLSTLSLVPLYLLLHWANWRLLHRAGGLLVRACGRGALRGAKAD